MPDRGDDPLGIFSRQTADVAERTPFWMEIMGNHHG